MKKVWHANRSHRWGIRDFSRRRYGNPLFAGSRSRGRGKALAAAAVTIRRAAAVILAVGALSAASWYLLWSPTFRIDTVAISGASPATEQSVRSILNDVLAGRSLAVLPNGNIFVFDDGAALSAMAAKFLFESVEIRKKLPRTVTVELAEKEPKAALVAGNRFFAVDAAGLVIRDLTDKEIAAMVDLPPGISAVPASALGAESMDTAAPETVAVSKKNRNPLALLVEPANTQEIQDVVKPGDPAIGPSALSLVLEAYARLPDIADAAVRWFEADEPAETVKAVMAGAAGDWTVHLSTTAPFELQGARLGLVLKEKIGARRGELEYVDLRYNERIFYRFRGATE